MRGVNGWLVRVLIVLVIVLSLGSSVLAQVPKIRLRIAFPSVSDMFDIPVMLSAERLRPRGIELEPIFFAQEVLALQSVIRGDAEIGAGASRGTLAAIQAGANLKFFATQNRNGWTLYGKKEISRCEDLNGKRLAIHSEAGISTAFVRGWLKEKCPQAKPNFLIIPGSENRAAALLANQIDVTPLELSDAIEVDRLRPGAFTRMADFSKDLPWLLDSVFYASPRGLSTQRDVMKTFVRELIQIHRLAARDPNVIAQVAPKYVRLQDFSLAPLIARVYVDAQVWPTDGGFTAPIVQRTTQFFVDIESIKPGLKAEEIGDYSIVREVVQELGK